MLRPQISKTVLLRRSTVDIYIRLGTKVIHVGGEGVGEERIPRISLCEWKTKHDRDIIAIADINNESAFDQLWKCILGIYALQEAKTQ